MRNPFDSREIWFLTGSQDLYGPETLEQVASQSREIATALEWAGHTVRGAMAGALKKKLGLTVTSEKVADRGRIYRIAG